MPIVPIAIIAIAALLGLGVTAYMKKKPHENRSEISQPPHAHPRMGRLRFKASLWQGRLFQPIFFLLSPRKSGIIK